MLYLGELSRAAGLSLPNEATPGYYLDAGIMRLEAFQRSHGGFSWR